MSEAECPFTGARCDGGGIHPDGRIGCAFKETPEGECAWMDDLRDGEHPRDFYNRMAMEAAS